MSTDHTIIHVKNVSAEITDSSNKSLGVFGVSQLTTDFSVGAIPTCTVHINDGTDFTVTKQSKSNVMTLISKQNTDNLHIKITTTISFSSSDKDINETLFNGVVTSIAMSYSYAGSGRSLKGIAITAIHRFADLYKFGAAGMIYAPASAITTATGIEAMKSRMSADSRASNKSSSLYSRPSVVRSVLERCVSDPNSSSTAMESIVETICTMVDTMYNGGILVPEKTDPKLRDYLKGTIKPNIQSRFVLEMYEFILNLVYNSVAVGNLADSITAICDKDYGFYIAPRSVDYLSILPSAFTAVAPKNIPVISTDRYSSITYRPYANIGTDVQGVLVTNAGSNTYGSDDGGGTSLIREKFPEDTGSESVRWLCIPSPKWFNGAALLYGNTKDDGTKQDVSNDVIRQLCKAYAADRYYNVRYSRNTLYLTTDMRAIQAYTALGAVFDIEYPSDQIEGSDKIRATLQSYQFNYRSSDEFSGVDIQLGFSGAHSNALPIVAQPDHMLYSIEDSDKITEFPDLSKSTQTPKK